MTTQTKMTMIATLVVCCTFVAFLGLLYAEEHEARSCRERVASECVIAQRPDCGSIAVQVCSGRAAR